MVSFTIETLDSGANLPLQTLLIKFEVPIVTFNNLLETAVLKEGLDKTNMEKVG